MRKLMMVGALVASIASMGAVATAATASDWHNNKGVAYPSGTATGAFSASAGTTRVRIQGPGGPFTWTCGTSSATGTLAGTASATGATGPSSGAWAPAGTLTPQSSCSNAGVTYTLTCAAASVDTGSAPGAYNGGTTTTYGGAGGNATSGTLNSVNCSMHVGSATGRVCKVIAGSAGFSYQNPSTVGGTLNPLSITADPAADASLTLPVAGQSLSATGACAPPDGPTTISTTTGGDPVYALTSALQPVLWYGAL